jgi:MATE family multidrug resistance protein
MLIAGFSYWLVGFPIGYYLAESQGMLAQGYWYGFVSGLTCAAILMKWRLNRLFKRLEKIDAGEIELLDSKA